MTTHADLDQIDAMLTEFKMMNHRGDVLTLVKETGAWVLPLLKVIFREGKRQGIMETTEQHNQYLCGVAGRLEKHNEVLRSVIDAR